jgi:hypothetical protein
LSCWRSTRPSRGSRFACSRHSCFEGTRRRFRSHTAGRRPPSGVLSCREVTPAVRRNRSGAPTYPEDAGR